MQAPEPAEAGAGQRISVPAGVRRVTIQAEDDAGNLGRAVTVPVAASKKKRSDRSTPSTEGPRPGSGGDPAVQDTARDVGGGLPFTGLTVALLLLAGLFLAGLGEALRRRAQPSR